MDCLSTFQRFELVLIPITMIFSQLIVFSLGSFIIKEQIWVLMVIPSSIGLLSSIFIFFILDKKGSIVSFDQLENLVIKIVLIGGILIIPILLGQILAIIPLQSIFTLLSFILSLIGGLLGICCIVLLWRLSLNQRFSK